MRLLVAVLFLPNVATAATAWQLQETARAPASPATMAAYRIAVSPAALTTSSEELVLPLPTGTVRAQRLEARQNDNRVLSWRGAVDGDPEQSVTLSFDGEHLAGYLSLKDGVYEATPSAQGNLLLRLDTERFPGCGGPIPISQGPGTLAGRATEGAGNEMDVLVVFSPGSLAQLGSQAAASTFAQQAVDSANLAYTNSQMTARMRLAGVRFTTRADSGSSSTDLSWLRGDAEVAGWRNEVAADMVGMIAEFSNACGQGYLMSSPGAGFAPNAFQVTARNCAIGNLSYAHEHGHNMGLQHNPENGSGAAYAYAYGHYVNGNFRTVMSYSNPCPGGCTRRPYFSNPAVNFTGQPTGVADQRDNARAGNQTAPVVAAFRTQRPDSIFAGGFE